jgi:hypothetical protein
MLVGDTLYIGGESFQDPENGGLYAFTMVDHKFPQEKGGWRFLPVKETLEYSKNWSGVVSSPVESNGVIYFGGLEGKLYAVKDQ